KRSLRTATATPPGRSKPPRPWRTPNRGTIHQNPIPGNSMDVAAKPTALPAIASSPPWMAAVAIVPILATVYQTLVLTDITDDVIRKGIDADRYSMIWTTVTWGVAILYGVFAGIWAMPRFGARDTLRVGLVWFAIGNLLCGAAI